MELTTLQKKYYRAVLEKNRTFLYAGAKTTNANRLLNVVINLRKVCNHPFLIDAAEEKETKDCKNKQDYERVLVQHSGKLVLVDKV